MLCVCFQSHSRYFGFQRMLTYAIYNLPLWNNIFQNYDPLDSGLAIYFLIINEDVFIFFFDLSDGYRYWINVPVWRLRCPLIRRWVLGHRVWRPYMIWDDLSQQRIAFKSIISWEMTRECSNFEVQFRLFKHSFLTIAHNNKLRLISSARQYFWLFFCNDTWKVMRMS